MGRRSSSAARPFYGLAAMCVGVGQGEATIIEYLDV
jgi:acetyl-CoA acetyltransferase